MEGPTSSWGSRNRITCLTLQEHDHDDERKVGFIECLQSFAAESFVFQFAIQTWKTEIYRTIILPFVLYGCKTWSLTLREERRLRVFVNSVLTELCVPKRDEVIGKCRKLQNGELNDLYSSPNILRVIKWIRTRRAGHVARMWKKRDVYRVLVGKPGGKGPLEDPDMDGRKKLRWIFRKWGVGARIGLSWLRIGKGGGHLWMR